MNFKTNAKSLALWVIFGLFLVAIFNVYQGHFKKEIQNIPLSDFISTVKAKKVSEVLIRDQDIRIVDDMGQVFQTYMPKQYNPIPLLEEHQVRFRALPPDTSSLTFLAILQILLPMLFFGLILFFVFRQMQSGSGRGMGFGRSRAKLSDPKTNTITFQDVAGMPEVKEELTEVVDFLKNPQKFQNIGGMIPRGILLSGPPGNGKTLLARAVAGEAKVPFFSISGSDFVEMFVGVGASRVRDLFSQAKQNAPCIIFIDEIDAVGRHRSAGGMSGGHDEREQTLNQLLVEMDGFVPKEGVIVMAATNRVDVLDPALLRPGRFDRFVYVDLPDLKGREAILKIYLKKIKHAKTVQPLTIARGTIGFSGADLSNLINESALRAASLNKKRVDPEDIVYAMEKLVMGLERKSKVILENDKKITAYHEAGHALVAYYDPDSDPIHKITIIPRGEALGMVVRFPDTDRVSATYRRLCADLAVAMAGRAAEEIIFSSDYITTGASSDFAQAHKIARKMVTEWGMSPLGPISYGQKSEVFSAPIYSDSMLQAIDQEIRVIVQKSYDHAKSVLITHLEKLHLLAKTLLEYESLSGEELKNLLEKGQKPALINAKAACSPRNLPMILK